MNPRFSIVLVHHQGSTPHSQLVRGVNSIYNQTYPNYELLAYHSGPLTDTSLPLPVNFNIVNEPNDFCGYASRHRGIYDAKGEYIIHFSSDNVLYPTALEEISQAIDRPARMSGRDTNNIIVYSIWVHGFQRIGDEMVRFPNNPEYRLLLSGNPPRVLYIDAMQGVVKREIWIAEGGWTEKSNIADGVMLERFAAKYGYRAVDTILGEHF